MRPKRSEAVGSAEELPACRDRARAGKCGQIIGWGRAAIRAGLPDRGGDRQRRGRFQANEQPLGRRDRLRLPATILCRKLKLPLRSSFLEGMVIRLLRLATIRHVFEQVPGLALELPAYSIKG